MKTNFNLHFYLKKPKNYLKGAVPIYLRITVDGKRAELCTSRECEPELWNSNVGHMVGTKEETKSLNSYLDKMMKARVTAFNTLLCKEDTEITAEAIKCKYPSKADKTHTICEAIKIHNKNIEALVEKDDNAEGTLKRFEVVRRHVKDFLALNPMGDSRWAIYLFLDYLDNEETVLEVDRELEVQYLTLFNRKILELLEQNRTTRPSEEASRK